MSTEVYLGYPPPRIRAWCEDNQNTSEYSNIPVTIEALEDNTHVMIAHQGDSQLTGTFQVKLNDAVKDVSWEDICNIDVYDILEIFDKQTLSAGDKLSLLSIDKWSVNADDWSCIQVYDGSAILYGSFKKTFTEDLLNSLDTYKFSRMFSMSMGIKSIENLDVSDVKITDNCFFELFSFCTGLKGKFNLPSKDSFSGYTNMFDYAGTANTKEIHLPSKFKDSVDDTLFGTDSGVSVIYDL